MKRIEFISPEEFATLYKYERDKEMKLIMLLAFGAGLRISEIIGLKKKVSNCHKADLILKRVISGNRKFKVYYCSKCNAELTFDDLRYSGEGWEIPPLTADKVDLDNHRIRIDKAKNDKWRVVPTPPLLTQDYLKYLPIKTPMRTVQHRFMKLSIKALGKKVSIHILRHGFGNYLANVLKASLPTVQSLMGHSRVDTTGIYTKVNPEEAIQGIWKQMNE
jgi:integrase